jgi:hypothetical protein
MSAEWQSVAWLLGALGVVVGAIAFSIWDEMRDGDEP